MESDPPEPTLELASRLIECRSVTPSDDGCLEIVRERLQRIGFDCESVDRGKVKNLWARKGCARPLFCFAGHVDVVPSGPLEKWQSPPFSPTLRDGKLFGRGANDMKSSIAAFVTALESFLLVHPGHVGSLAVLLTSDEEGEAIDGTVAVTELLAERGELIDYCLIGEPTSSGVLGDTVKNGRRGSLSGHLSVFGTQGHVAYPHLADNPIHRVAPAIAELASSLWDQGNSNFPPTTWQLSNIHGGTGAGNVIPGSVEIDFNFRFSPESTPEALKSRVSGVLERHGLNFRIEWTLGARPFHTGQGSMLDAVLDAIRAETGLVAELSTSGGTSDGRFLIDVCPQVLEFGPVNATIHQVDECIVIADLPRLSSIYSRVLEQLLPDALPDHV